MEAAFLVEDQCILEYILKHYLHIANETNVVRIARFTLENALVDIECYQNYVYSAWPVFPEIGEGKNPSRLFYRLSRPGSVVGYEQTGVQQYAHNAYVAFDPGRQDAAG